jgi:Tol biopolymer transport system component
MPSVDDRFRSLSRTRAPDLWRDIEVREPRSLPQPTSRRVVAVLLALLIAGSGAAFVAITFWGGGAQPTVDVPGVPVANGAIAFVSDGALWVVEPDGSGTREIPLDVPGQVGSVSWSPNGQRIAFDVSYPDEGAPKGGLYDIYSADADGSGVVRLTREGDARLPAWSPNGTRIAFTRQDGGGSQIFVMNADGSGATALTSGSAFNVRPAWSPDGSRIAFESVADSNADILVMNADGRGPTRLTDDPAWDGTPVWSPDGNQIAFASDRSPPGVYLMNADGSGVRLLEPDDDVANLGLAWSPDGRFLALSSSRGTGFARAVYVLDLSSGDVTPITDRGPIWGPSWQAVTEPLETVAPVPTGADVVETFEVGVDVRSVVYGEGSVWVAASNGDGSFAGRIVRLDQETHDVLADIPVETIPTWEVGGGAMVFADGDLWVTGSLEAEGSFDDPGGGADAAVIRIDAATNEVVQTFPLGGRHGADLTFLDGQLWVLLFGDETVDYAMEVVRVDPATGDVMARIPLETGWAHTIAAAEGHLVVYEGGQGEGVNVGGHVTSIDPATDAVGVRVQVPSEFFEGGPVVWRDQVLVAAEDGFARFDPVTGELTPGSAELDPSRYAFCCGFVEADDRGIWFIGFDGQTGQGARRLDVFDPTTGEVTELVELVDGNPVAMAIAPGAVWILNYEGTLTHVELR